MASFVLACGPTDPAASERGSSRDAPLARGEAPNILLIVADDLGYGDLGLHNPDIVSTPRLDALAAEGLHFTDFYADSPMCSASRASLLTGRTPRHHGLGSSITTAHGDGLSLDERLLPELLVERGYATGLIGKWHLGHAGAQRPTRRGFQEFFGMLRASSGYTSHSWRGLPDLWRGEQAVTAEGRYSTELFSDEAVSFIERHAHDAWFLTLSYNAPHLADDRRSMPAPAEQLARFTQADGAPLEGLSPERAAYLATVAALDQGIGKVLDALAAADLERDTLVVFLSDNGALPPWGSNAPFIGMKDSLDEGGIRVPCLVRWPGHVPAGARRIAPARGSDWFPTLLAVAGARRPAEPSLDGVDLSALLFDDVTPDRPPLAFEHLSRRVDSNGQPRHDFALRDGRWRLDLSSSGKPRLFDLRVDPGQQRDLAGAQPEKTAALRAMLESSLAR
ncbi:MAG: N-acetylgalactosamine-6-sulfatase [Planctomycetota bacterium]|nr:MAG: N-acetylgalactosamine-6-sulfatase [Planctomycetota bacterium]